MEYPKARDLHWYVHTKLPHESAPNELWKLLRNGKTKGMIGNKFGNNTVEFERDSSC
jgi:hypothetical protein